MSFEYGGLAVLRQVLSLRRLACCDAHVANDELHGICDLARKRAGDLLCVQLTRSPVGTAIVSRDNGRVAQPILR